MNKKLFFDILVGSVIPILILSNLNEQLGTETTYVVAALVPVVWVLIDSLFITKRFNFITSYIGAFAIVRGLLAFWFVDGIQFAFKDSVGSILLALVFGGSI
ncbi:MAG: VC0807 family protein, partial [Cyanobacteria bacterium J06607_17]